MNKTAFIIAPSLLLFSISFCFSKTDKGMDTETGIEFFTGTYNEALIEAQATNKPIMVSVSTSWCGYCKKMKKNTFTDATVATYYNQNFINIEVDAEHGEGISIAQKYQVSSYPTIIYLDKNEKTLLFSEGYMRAEHLINAGEMAIKNLK